MRFGRRAIELAPPTLSVSTKEETLAQYRPTLPESMQRIDKALQEIAHGLEVKLPRGFKAFKCRSTEQPSFSPTQRVSETQPTRVIKDPSPEPTQPAAAPQVREPLPTKVIEDPISEPEETTPKLQIPEVPMGELELRERSCIKSIQAPQKGGTESVIRNIYELAEIGGTPALQVLKVIINGHSIDRFSGRPAHLEHPDVIKASKYANTRISHRIEEGELLLKLSPQNVTKDPDSLITSAIRRKRLEETFSRLESVGRAPAIAALNSLASMEPEYQQWNKYIEAKDLSEIRFAAQRSASRIAERLGRESSRVI